MRPAHRRSPQPDHAGSGPLGSPSFDVTLNYAGLFDAGATPSQSVLRAEGSGSSTTNGVPSGTSITATGVLRTSGLQWFYVGTPLLTPPNAIATATSTSQVSVTWTGMSGLTYEIYRSSLNSAYALIGTVSNGFSFTDNGRNPNTTYLYKARAIEGASTSALGTIDEATTILFTDSALLSTIKAVHITELRTAVNAIRAAAGLSASTFTDSPLTAGTPIKRVHITEPVLRRTALRCMAAAHDAVRGALLRSEQRRRR